MTTKQENLTEDTFLTERGDKVTLTTAPAKCWALGGEDAQAADSLYARWRALRDELTAAEARYVDQTRALERLEAEAQDRTAQALIDAAIVGADAAPKALGKLDKAIDTARAELAATETRCAILPKAIQQCASQWAAAAAEVLLARLHESSPAADELAAEVEAAIPDLTQRWRAFAKEQSAVALGLARIAEATGGKVRTAELRMLCGESLSNIVSMALQRGDCTITLRAPQRHSIRASAFLTGTYNCRY